MIYLFYEVVLIILRNKIDILRSKININIFLVMEMSTYFIYKSV